MPNILIGNQRRKVKLFPHPESELKCEEVNDKIDTDKHKAVSAFRRDCSHHKHHNTLIKMKCRKSNHIYYHRADHITTKGNAGCPFCSSHKPRDKKSIALRVKEKYKGHYEFIDHKHGRIYLYCKDHDIYFDRSSCQVLEHLTAGKCPKCRYEYQYAPMTKSARTRKIQSMKKNLKEQTKGRVSLVSIDGNTVLLNCKKHGQFETKLQSHCGPAGHCTQCWISIRSINNRRYTKQEIRDLVKKNSNGRIEIAGKFINKKNQKVKLHCKKHDHYWKGNIGYILNGKNRYGCKRCWIDNIMTSGCQYGNKDYQLGNRTVKVQGYESFAIDYLVNEKHVNPKRITVASEKRIPIILYDKHRKHASHYPDIMIYGKAGEQFVIEVKGLYTFASTQNNFNSNKKKYLAAKQQGYNYRIWVFDSEGNKVILPRKWYKMTYEEFLGIEDITVISQFRG